MTAPAGAPVRWWLLALAPLLALVSQTLLVLVPIAVLAACLAARGNRVPASFAPLWLLLLVLALVNSQKLPESDLGDYYRYVDHVANTPLWQVFFTDEAYISIDPSEVLFKAFVALAAAVGDGGRVAFTVLATLVIYGTCAALGYRLISMHAAAAGARDTAGGAWRLRVTLLLCCALLLGVTFSVTAHLTRQYLAGAVFFFGLIGYLFHGRVAWLVLALLSVTVHRSAALLLLPLLLMLMHRRAPRMALAGIGLVALAGLLNPAALLLDPLVSASLAAEEGAQPVSLMLLDAVTLTLGGWLCMRRGHLSAGPAGSTLRHAGASLLVFMAAMAAVLLLSRGLPLLFFRSYFYVEFLRAPFIALLLYALLQRLGSLGAPLALALALLGGAACWTRTAGAEWNYTDDGFVPFHLPAVMHRWQRVENT